MTTAQALRLARQALQREAKRLAFDANLYAKGIKTNWTQEAHLERQKVLEAIEIIEAMN